MNEVMYDEYHPFDKAKQKLNKIDSNKEIKSWTIFRDLILFRLSEIQDKMKLNEFKLTEISLCLFLFCNILQVKGASVLIGKELFQVLYNQYNLQSKFSTMNKNLFPDENPQIKELPSTPKKKSVFKEVTAETPSRIKYRYTVVQKPSSTWLGNLFVIIWIVVFVSAFYLSYDSKVKQMETSIKQEIAKCQKDFAVNKCETPLKGLKIFCEEKKHCMAQDWNEVLKRRISGTLILGETIREFFEGLGLPLIVIGMIYMIFGSRKNSEVKKQFVEYC